VIVGFVRMKLVWFGVLEAEKVGKIRTSARVSFKPAQSKLR
jgi:hypothetical protein